MKNSNITLEFTQLPQSLINYFQNSQHILTYEINQQTDTISFITTAPYLIIQHIHNNYLNILLSE